VSPKGGCVEGREKNLLAVFSVHSLRPCMPLIRGTIRDAYITTTSTLPVSRYRFAF